MHDSSCHKLIVYSNFFFVVLAGTVVECGPGRGEIGAILRLYPKVATLLHNRCLSYEYVYCSFNNVQLLTPSYI